MRRPATFLKTRVGRQILVLFMACALLPVALLAVVVYQHVSEQLLEQSRGRLVQSSKTVGMELLQRLQGVASALERAGVSVELRSRDWAPDSVLRPFLRDRGIASLVVERHGRWEVLAGQPGHLPDLPQAQQRHLLSGKPAILVDTSAGAARIWMVRRLPREDMRVWAEVGASHLWGADGAGELIPANQDLCVFGHDLYSMVCTRAIEGVALADATAGRAGTFEWRARQGDFVAGYWSMFLGFEYGAPSWTVVLSESRGSVLAPLAAFQRSFIAVIVLTLGVVFWLSNVQIRRSLKPLEELQQGTRRLAQQDFSSPVVVHGGDEFADLAGSFNSMTDRLRLSFGALRASHEIDQVALANPDPGRIVDALLHQIQPLVPQHRAGVALRGEREESRWRLAIGQEPITRHDVTLSLDETAVLLTGEEVVLDGSVAAVHPLVRHVSPADGRALVIPLQGRPGIIGVLLLGGIVECPADSRVVVRRLADQLVMALSHASLFRDLDELGWGALRALARAIDANSPWTAGHSERVGLVAAAIGRELGLEPRQLDCLHRGGLLHDVGKIGVPADILNKPGRLTPAELEKVRAHPAMGATILAPIQAYQDLLPLVRSHHELLDGSGYPEGLVGGQIPPLVRVLTVADIFDALVSDRPYRDAWNARKAIDYIAGGAGVTFDPQVVDAFRAVVFQGSADLWRAYPMLERQLAREAGFARTGTRQKVGRPW